MENNSEKRQKYVLGFAFSLDFQKVTLIRKKRPEWQNGSLNGIGGKIEKDETGFSAMVREFEEETGYNHTGWTLFATLYGSTKKGDKWLVECYRASLDLNQLKTQTDEQVEIYNVRQVNVQRVLFNLRWLIPMALDKQIVNAEVFHF